MAESKRLSCAGGLLALAGLGVMRSMAAMSSRSARVMPTGHPLAIRAGRSRAVAMVSQSARCGWLPRGKAFYLRRELELRAEGAEAVLGAELEVARQAESVDQRGGSDGGVAAVQQAPVHADVVPDDTCPLMRLASSGSTSAGRARQKVQHWLGRVRSRGGAGWSGRG